MRVRGSAAAVLLVLVLAAADAAEPRWAFDARALVEVKTLRALPREVTQLLGVGGGIADAGEPFSSSGAGARGLPQRRLLLAASSLSSVLVAYEQGGPTVSLVAGAFVLERAGWRQVRTWALQRPPTGGLHALLQAIGQEPDDSLKVNGIPWRHYQALMARADETRPRRRHGPLRVENLSDEEVREIESATHNVWPGSIVNISGVVSGCACEDGASCSDQVWTVAYRADATPRVTGLQLSRINGRWGIGPVQAWWLELAQLENSPRTGSSSDYRARWQALYERFPACAVPAVRSAAAARP